MSASTEHPLSFPFSSSSLSPLPNMASLAAFSSTFSLHSRRDISSSLNLFLSPRDRRLGGLTRLDWIAIGIAVFVVVLIWLGVVIWLFFRHRERKRLRLAADAEKQQVQQHKARSLSAASSDAASARSPASSAASAAGRGERVVVRPPLAISAPLESIGMPSTQMGTYASPASMQPSAAGLGPSPLAVQPPHMAAVPGQTTIQPGRMGIHAAWLAEQQQLAHLPPAPRYSTIVGTAVLPRTGETAAAQAPLRQSPPGQTSPALPPSVRRPVGHSPAGPEQQALAHETEHRGRSEYVRDANGFFVRAEEKRPLPDGVDEPPDAGYYVP